MTAGLQSNSLSNRSVRGEKVLLFKNDLNNFIVLFNSWLSQNLGDLSREFMYGT